MMKMMKIYAGRHMSVWLQLPALIRLTETETWRKCSLHIIISQVERMLGGDV